MHATISKKGELFPGEDSVQRRLNQIKSDQIKSAQTIQPLVEQLTHDCSGFFRIVFVGLFLA